MSKSETTKETNDMTKLNRQIIKAGGKSSVLDISLRTVDAHKKDLNRRLKTQQKALEKGIAKGWSGNNQIADSIANIKATISVLENWSE